MMQCENLVILKNSLQNDERVTSLLAAVAGDVALVAHRRSGHDPKKNDPRIIFHFFGLKKDP